mmetsp:Transcript_22782/g.73470  ORF Transcript_22782/g.73470 Transcript_22782/m.73470 type:complete len:248 (+) Transcript_22782:215-958(+)
MPRRRAGMPRRRAWRRWRWTAGMRRRQQQQRWVMSRWSWSSSRSVRWSRSRPPRAATGGGARARAARRRPPPPGLASRRCFPTPRTSTPASCRPQSGSRSLTESSRWFGRSAAGWARRRQRPARATSSSPSRAATPTAPTGRKRRLCFWSARWRGARRWAHAASASEPRRRGESCSRSSARRASSVTTHSAISSCSSGLAGSESRSSSRRSARRSTCASRRSLGRLCGSSRPQTRPGSAAGSTRWLS